MRLVETIANILYVVLPFGRQIYDQLFVAAVHIFKG